LYIYNRPWLKPTILTATGGARKLLKIGAKLEGYARSLRLSIEGYWYHLHAVTRPQPATVSETRS
jgi:hypothetical protein